MEDKEPYKHLDFGSQVPDAKNILCFAIKNRNKINLTYMNTNGGRVENLIVDPYIVGLTKFKMPEVRLIGWTDGSSNTSRQYIEVCLEEIRKLEVLEEKYQFTEMGYDPKPNRFKEIYCSVPRLFDV